MSVLYNQSVKSKYRITLELETLSDFNPHDISWEKVFELQDNEMCKSIIEDMSNPVSWETFNTDSLCSVTITNCVAPT